MKKLLSILYALACASALAQTNNPPSAPTSTVTLSWVNPIQSTPGITYALWMGTNSGSYAMNWNAGSNNWLTVSNLVRGTTYYFAVNAQSTNGLASAYSNEVAAGAASVPVGVNLLHLTWTVP